MIIIQQIIFLGKCCAHTFLPSLPPSGRLPLAKNPPLFSSWSPSCAYLPPQISGVCWSSHCCWLWRNMAMTSFSQQLMTHTSLKQRMNIAFGHSSYWHELLASRSCCDTAVFQCYFLSRWKWDLYSHL